MRLFIAIDLPEEIKEKLFSFQRVLRFVRGKFVEKENLHLTLKFLGEVDPKTYKKVDELLKEIRFPKFRMVLKSVGAFPNENNPRVIWIGVGVGYENLIALHNEIDKRLRKLGFPVEQNFVPHITLVRVKGIIDKRSLRDFFEEYGKEEFGEFEVSDFRLKKSTLTPHGPIYEDLNIYPLQ